jgi:wobble nucleotide-excising tRNase
MSNGQDEQDREVIEKFKSEVISELKKLKEEHKRIKTDLNAAVKMVKKVKRIVNRFYGPSCKVNK